MKNNLRLRAARMLQDAIKRGQLGKYYCGEKLFNELADTLPRKVEELCRWVKITNHLREHHREWPLRFVMTEMLPELLKDTGNHITNLESLIPRNVSPQKIPSIKDIVAEIVSCEQILKDVHFADGWLSCKTKAITLLDSNDEEHYLGPFKILLNLRCSIEEGIGAMVKIDALDPHQSSQGHSHPHVNDDRLCSGDGYSSIIRAWSNGNLEIVFRTISAILDTYNSDGAYQQLEKWDGFTCHSCESEAHQDDSFLCEWCNESYCLECVSCCYSCETSFCVECVQYESCSSCGDINCNSCMSKCSLCYIALCDSCAVSCCDCGEQVCGECAPKCSVCADDFCNECVTDCNDCGCEACNSCTTECSKCYNNSCPNCTIECSECGANICQTNCSIQCSNCGNNCCKDCIDEEKCSLLTTNK